MACQQILVIAVLFVFRNISSQQCGIDTYSIYQMMLKGHTYKTFKARPLSVDCRLACNSDVRCQSYNYVMFNNTCELSNRTKGARPEDFMKDRNRYYIAKAPYRVPLGSIAELPADSCGEIKASEGGQAVSGKYWLDSTRSGNSILVSCDMKTGVTDYCINHQCQNNATCINSHVNYTCVCNSSGWTGNYCEKDVNECAQGLHGCHSNAICNNIKGFYNCTCKPGFQGDGKNSCAERRTALLKTALCPPSWISFGGSCYRLFMNKKKWSNADTFCKENGAHLVKIESDDENSFFKYEFLAGDVSYWIGLTDAETENVWKWSDGGQLTGYQNWNINEPNNFNNQDCVAITNNGWWHDAECTNTRGYICEVPFQHAPFWIAFKGSWYRLFSDEKDRNDADAICKANGAQLVKIESAEENDFINNQVLVGNVSYWTGLTDAETEDVWKWSDGSLLTGYTNWKSDEPNNYNNQDCVAIAKGNFDRKVYNGEWHDAECTNTRGYICEM